MLVFENDFYLYLKLMNCYFCCRRNVSPSSPSPVTQQMTAMSISQESGPVDSDRAETEEGEEEGTSNSTGTYYRRQINPVSISL